LLLKKIYVFKQFAILQDIIDMNTI